MQDETADDNNTPPVNEEIVVVDDEDGPQIRNPKIMNLPVRIIVSVGTVKMTVRELLEVSADSVIDLDSRIEDPAEIYVDEQLIAYGELVEAPEGGGRLGIRVTDVCDLSF